MRLRIAVALVVAMFGSLLVPSGSLARHPQDDAGSGGDAGDAFDTATPIVPQGSYAGRLDADSGDRHDYFRFHLDEGESAMILVGVRGPTDPIELLDPNGLVVDTGMQLAGFGVGGAGLRTGDIVTGAVWDYPIMVRLAVEDVLVAGDYRLHLKTERFPLAEYALCFVNCEEPEDAPIGFVFGGSLHQAHTSVLLIPPVHGDLGNPLGPTVLDYIEATLRGVRAWSEAIEDFTADYPEYGYLREIEVEIEIFDRTVPVDPAGYDVIIGYVATGPVFRGVASGGLLSLQGFFDEYGLGDAARFSGRFMLLSLFAASPRAGQARPDFPEVNDLEMVTMHEFGHTFGVGHTLTWREDTGPDLMNSPATFVYGDGSPIGDGGERTPMTCLSTLNLYALAELYRWIPSGHWERTWGSTELPEHIPYERFC